MNRTSIYIDNDAQELARHLASVAVIATRMLHRVLSLSTPELEAFLNSGESASKPEAFEAHWKLGEAVNASGIVASAMLAQWGVAIDIPTVDVRSVPEKLADQFREISHNGSAFVVTDLPRPELPDDGLDEFGNPLPEIQTEAAGAALAV